MRVKRAGVGPPFLGNEGRDGVRDIRKGNLATLGYLGIHRFERGAISFNRRNTFGNKIPSPALAGDAAQSHSLGHVVFAVMPGHFIRAQHREHGLGRQKIGKTLGHILVQRRPQTTRA